jgi:hypothetical protein
MARWNSCNVLQTATEGGRLWQFDAKKAGFALSQERALKDGEMPGSTTKTWSSIWQPKLNVAWLPFESVFLRVVQLPQSSPTETLSMVELQLEKLSPIPVAQVVWSVQPLQQSAEGLQTIIVILAERRAVEEFLGRLEGRGFLADRLELPSLDLLLATRVTGDGAWIYPITESATPTALVAWWYGGMLHNITFVSLDPNSEHSATLNEQLSQTVWAGELEGWLTSPPAWHLIADGAVAGEWETALREGLGQPVSVTPPPSPTELAGRTANRATQPDSKTNLLPPEFSKRYQQQFVDKLWIRGLMAVGVVYVACVLVYFAIVGVVGYQAGTAKKQARSLSGSYTNAIQAKAKLNVLKERQELKFAALDCMRAVAELLPETLTLDNFNFRDGKVLSLNGTAPRDSGAAVLDYYEAMRKATKDGQPLFTPTGGDPYDFRVSGNSPNGTWKFGLEMKKVVAP